jgi:hypothetical protein
MKKKNGDFKDIVLFFDVNHFFVVMEIGDFVMCIL